MLEPAELRGYVPFGICVEDPFQFEKIGDFETPQVLAEGRGIKGGRSHNVVVLTGGSFKCE